MIAKRHKLGRYLIIEISDEFTIIADLQELDIFIDGLIQQGQRFLALRFEQVSYIYSGALSVLLKNVRKLRDHEGDICLLEPNREIADLIRITNLHKTLRIFNTEEELLSHQERALPVSGKS